jgi:hypothetical protein
MPFGVLLDSGRDAFAFADTEVAAGSTFAQKQQHGVPFKEYR